MGTNTYEKEESKAPVYGFIANDGLDLEIKEWREGNPDVPVSILFRRAVKSYIAHWRKNRRQAQ